MFSVSCDTLSTTECKKQAKRLKDIFLFFNYGRTYVAIYILTILKFSGIKYIHIVRCTTITTISLQNIFNSK